MIESSRRFLELSFGALTAVSTLVACGGPDSNMQPQTAATTTTTSATPIVSDPSPPPAIAASPDPRAPAVPPTQVGGIDAPVNLAPPLPDSATPPTPRDGAQPSLAASMSDAQMAEVIDAANNGEIDQAREALRKTKDARVKELANHMITDHGKAEEKLRTIDRKNTITPQDSGTSDQIKRGGERVMITLRGASGADLDKAYVDAQVDQHKKVLDLLDQFVPQAQSTDLRDYLKEVRTKVAHHLKMAVDLQTELHGS